MTVNDIYKLYDRNAAAAEIWAAYTEVALDNRDDNFHDCTALHLAAEMGDADAIGLLLARGAEVDVRDGRGYTPLHCLAIVTGEQTISGEQIVESARLLLEHGARITRSASPAGGVAAPFGTAGRLNR